MSLRKVVVTHNDFPECGLQLLRERFHVDCCPYPGRYVNEGYLMEHIKGASALFCRGSDHISEEVLDAAGPQLKIVATLSIGYERIDVEACKRRNIQVTNAANALYVSIVAEFTVGFLMTVSRRFVEADAFVRNDSEKVWSMDMLAGRGVFNSTIGIVGMGRIGQGVLERILSFHPAKVFYCNNSQPRQRAESLGARYSSFDDLLKASDFVIVTCSLTDQNRGMFDSRAFSLMKPNAVFINTSRGEIVDQDALIAALKTKQIKAAGIDVMYPEPLPKDHELLSLPNLVLTPHIAPYDELALAKISSLAAENIVEVLEGRKPLTPVY